MKSCRYLEGGLSFAHSSVKVCAIRHHGRGAPELTRIGDGEFNLENILRTRESIKQQNQENPHPSCEGCPNLIESDWTSSSYPINWIGITNFSTCNISCNFCWLTWAQWSPRNSLTSKPSQQYEIIPLIKEMAKKNMLSPNTVIDWGGGGEPTLSPEFDWCFDFFQNLGFTQWIHTNSVKMPKSISEMKTGLEKTHILTSIDAGTADTYRLTKKSAAFDSVWENLRGYKDRGAKVNIKYIATEDNCSETDTQSFIQLAKELAPEVVLLDIDYRHPEPSQPVFNGLLRMQALAKEAGIYAEYGSTGGNSALEHKVKERLNQEQNYYEVQQIDQHRSINYEKGDISGISNKTKTTIVLTVHRAASTLLGSILDLIHESTNLPLHSQNGPYTNLPDFQPKNSIEILQNCYGIIGPLRFPVSDRILRRCNIVLHLRNPLDVLVSLYYSAAFSHENIPEEERIEIRNMGIDQFVMMRAPVYLRRFNRYAVYVQSYPVHLLQYEELILNREDWLDRFLEAFMIENSLRDGIRTKIANLLNKQISTPLHENVHAHIRQVAPKDHQRKLQPETISHLNELFNPVCEKLGIPLFNQ